MAERRLHRTWTIGKFLFFFAASGCAILAGIDDLTEGSSRPPPAAREFRMDLGSTSMLLAGGENAEVRVTLVASPPIVGRAQVRVEGLPSGVDAPTIAIATDADSAIASGTLVFKAAAEAPRNKLAVRIVATADDRTAEGTLTLRVTQRVVFQEPQTTPLVVPDGVTVLHVRAWGSGGGAGQSGGVGGGGAFLEGDVDVVPGETLEIRVGAGGAGSSGADGTGGGGGGGLTGIFRGAPVVLAGAGGGGGGGGGAGGGGSGGAAGASGGAALAGTVAGGGGGTASAGGEGGRGGDCGDAGAPGQSLAGGNGAGASGGGVGGDAGGGSGSRTDNGGAGGGGAGLFGGGGGGCGGLIVVTRSGGAGGGGGSSHAPKTGRVVDGTGSTPGGVAEPDYDGVAGKGGATQGASGSPGRMVLRY